MSADLSPHTYKPLPTEQAHCAECLGTRRDDFCQDEGVVLVPFLDPSATMAELDADVEFHRARYEAALAKRS